jgi:DNA-binding MarR family transcriptional regulator
MKQLSAIAKYWCIYTHRNLQDTELAKTEHSIIMYLSLEDNVSQDTISEHLLLDKGTIAKTLAKLEEKNLVQRVVNQQNRRENIVSLTETGQKEVKTVQDIGKSWNASLMEGLPEEELLIFTKVLATMTERAKTLAYEEKDTPNETR